MSDEQRRVEEEALAGLGESTGADPTIDPQNQEREKQARLQAHLSRRIIENNPLPDGFINPPGGQQGHYCLDGSKVYQPKWVQLLLPKIHEHQQDPQPVGCCDKTYNVPLDTWVDVPMEVVTVLNDAVEGHHDFNPKPGQIALGQPTEYKSVSRPRFHTSVLPSA